MDFFPISWSSNHIHGLLTAVFTSRPQALNFFRQNVFPVFTLETDATSENPPSLWNRISNDMRDNPGIWVAIACQVSIMALGIILNHAILTVMKVCVLTALIRARYWARENNKLQREGDRKNIVIDRMTSDTTAREETLKQTSKNNALLSKQVQDLEATKNGLEQQLGKLKSVTTDLMSSIATLDNSQALFSSAAKEREANFLTHIEHLKTVGKDFIELVTKNTDVWSRFTAHVHGIELKITETTTKLEEKNAQLQETTEQLGLVKQLLTQSSELLAETTTTLAERLGGVADQLGAAATRVDEFSQQDNLTNLAHQLLSAVERSPDRNKRVLRSITPDGTTPSSKHATDQN
jgi:chromosome segregation ATPase